MQNPEAVAWFIAGEGSIGIGKNPRSTGRTFQYCPVVVVSNTDRNLLEKFQSYAGCGKIYNGARHRNDNPKWKPVYDWKLFKMADIIKFLREILPVLPSKQRQAKLVIQFCERRLERLKYRGHREHIYDKIDDAFVRKIHILNKRGKQ